MTPSSLQAECFFGFFSSHCGVKIIAKEKGRNGCMHKANLLFLCLRRRLFQWLIDGSFGLGIRTIPPIHRLGGSTAEFVLVHV